MLYRIVYETDSGAEGVFLYLDGEHIEPYVVRNTHEMHIPELEYAVIGTYKTEINGEPVPLKELQDVALVDDPEKTMRLPERFENKTMPEIDRMDELRK